jgi:anti-anti-sigma factor
MIQISSGPRSTVVCRPLGDLDLNMSTELRHVVGDLVRPGLSLVLDLCDVERSDAIGISAVVGSVRRVRAAGGSACIRNANPRVASFLRFVGAERLTPTSLPFPHPDAA